MLLDYTGGMKTPEEKRWERMQQLLLAESNGEAPVRVSSQRTLFGIRSHVEEVVEAVAAEDRAKCEEAARGGRGEAGGGEGLGAGTGPGGASAACGE